MKNCKVKLAAEEKTLAEAKIQWDTLQGNSLPPLNAVTQLSS